MRVWVADASPLIFLAKLDRLDLLIESADQILLPPTVLSEVQAHSDVATLRIENALPSFDVRMPAVLPALKILKANLDAGEAEVIALAIESGAERVVMDDLEARRFARRVGLSPIGTLGLLLAARLRGKLPSIRKEIEKLRDHGFRVSGSLIRAILKAGDEL